jgi:uncharacterized phage-like protein YoqJ
MILTATGHRPDKLGGYGNRRAFRNLLWLAGNAVERLQPEKVISGLAQGWDTAVAAAALTRGVPLVAAIPFKGQENRWPEVAKERYRLMLKMAAEIRIVSTGTYSPEKMQIRNEWMVDHADYLIALFDGSQGGTRNCLLYRRDHKPDMPCENLWPQWLDLMDLV